MERLFEAAPNLLQKVRWAGADRPAML